MKRILSKTAAWYGNDVPNTINPGRRDREHIGELIDFRSGPKTEDEVKEQWDGKVKEKDLKCKCTRKGKKCKCGEDCPCQKL